MINGDEILRMVVVALILLAAVVGGGLSLSGIHIPDSVLYISVALFVLTFIGSGPGQGVVI